MTDTSENGRGAWPLVRLGDVCEIQLGKMLSPASKQGLRPVPYLRNANVQWGRFDLRDVSTMDFDEEQEAKLSLRADDLLVCEGGEPGRAAVWNNEIKRCCYQKALHRLRPINADIDPHFVMYRLWLAAFEGEFLRSTAKSTIAHLPAVRLAQFEIPMPPLTKQRRIAARLREQFSILKEAHAALDAQFKTAEVLPAANLRAVFESEEAQSWSNRPIGEFAGTLSGTTPSRGNRDYYNGKIPWVKTGELRDGLIHDTEEHVSEMAMRETSLRLLPKDTLLIAMYGQGQTRGRTGLLAVPATTNQACFAITPNPTFKPQFLQFWFQFSYERLRRETEGRGGNQPNLNGLLLNRLSVPLPHIERQCSIAARLEIEFSAARALRQAMIEKLKDLEKLPAALLRSAFSPNGA